jgi:hypothetical protein
MKRINFKISVIALAIGMIMVSCGGGGGGKQQAATTPETQTEQAAASGNLKKATARLFPGSDLTDFVPSFATGLETIPDDNSLAFFTIESFDGLNNEQYNEWVQSLFAKAKALSDDGKVYKYQPDLVRMVKTAKIVGDEITQIIPQTRNMTHTSPLAYKHNGVWWHLGFSPVRNNTYVGMRAEAVNKPGVALSVATFENNE